MVRQRPGCIYEKGRWMWVKELWALQEARGIAQNAHRLKGTEPAHDREHDRELLVLYLRVLLVSGVGEVAQIPCCRSLKRHYLTLWPSFASLGVEVVCDDLGSQFSFRLPPFWCCLYIQFYIFWRVAVKSRGRPRYLLKFHLSPSANFQLIHQVHGLERWSGASDS